MIESWTVYENKRYEDLLINNYIFLHISDYLKITIRRFTIFTLLRLNTQFLFNYQYMTNLLILQINNKSHEIIEW